MDEKQCGKCKIIKPLSAFSRDRTRRDGLARRCKQCYSDYNKYGQATRKKRVARPAPPEGQKWCTACNEAKPFASFSVKKDANDGRYSRCKVCQRAEGFRYRGANVEKKRLGDLAYRTANKAQYSERAKTYYREHRDEVKARVAAYRVENPGKVREATRRCYALYGDRYLAARVAYYKAHRDDINGWKKAYYTSDPKRYEATRQVWAKANAERMRAYKRKWAQDNWDRVKASHKQWALDHPEQARHSARIQDHRRRARVRQAEGAFTRHDIAYLLNAQDNRCAYCATPLTAYHIEHKIPLARGGTNWPSNICISCPPCNLKKGVQTDNEFIARLRI